MCGKFFQLLWLSLLLSLTACGDSQRLERLQATDTILAFGDSLTSGKGTSPETAYPAVLAQLTGRTVVNAGISVEMTFCVTCQPIKLRPTLPK